MFSKGRLLLDLESLERFVYEPLGHFGCAAFSAPILLRFLSVFVTRNLSQTIFANKQDDITKWLLLKGSGRVGWAGCARIGLPGFTYGIARSIGNRIGAPSPTWYPEPTSKGMQHITYGFVL